MNPPAAVPQSASSALNASPTPDNAGIMNQISQQDQRTQGIVNQEQQEMAPILSQANQAMNQPRPAPPQLQTPPQKPDFQGQMKKNGEEFILTSTFLSGLVSVFTRKHLTTALSAFGAAVKGFHDGQLEAAKNGFDAWKEASDQVLKNNQALLDQYQQVFQDRKATVDEISARMGLIAAKYKDPLMAQAASGKNMAIMAQLYERNTEATMRYEAATDKLEQQYEKWQSQIKAQIDAVGLDPKTPEGQAALAKMDPKVAKQFIETYKFTHPDDSGKIDDAGIDFAATQYRLTGTMPGLGMGAADVKEKIINRAAAQAKSLGESSEDVTVNQSAVKADKTALNDATKRTAQIEAYERTAQDSGNLIRQLAPKGIGPSGVPVFDTWLQAGRKATGDADVTKFSNAIDTYTSEYAKVMSGGTGSAAASTDSATLKAEGLINNAQTMGQLLGALDTMNKEMSFRIHEQYQEIETLKNAIRNPGNTAEPAPPAAGNGGGGQVLRYDAQGNLVQ
jgi:hypothetical protein